ncbi:serine protease [Streptomyces sp. WAC 01325]|uniref:trypsin-like serine peptidase n=1 Tax=Streptomyces sp. WAC 01325 TaxID=2203202 RepID=UPI0021AF37B2|nr:hypothetical protein [Streptomyces sp. WAC 01325]
MLNSSDAGVPVADTYGDNSASQPAPDPSSAQPAALPYDESAPIIGKVFFDGPQGSKVCSGTAVKDPAQPRRSSLVWTAGHCVHAGSKGGWYRNIVFVPAYNTNGLSGTDRQNAPVKRIAPFGVWWADWAHTSTQWISKGTHTGHGTAFDFAVLHVRPPLGSASLEETLGQAASVRFGIPSSSAVPSTSAWGYPASNAFDGESMFYCHGRPDQFVVDEGQPFMYRIGCTMTGGSSGGGWFARNRDRSLTLISNTSIGSLSGTWLAGPHLGVVAQNVYKSVSAKFAPGSHRSSPSE